MVNELCFICFCSYEKTKMKFNKREIKVFMLVLVDNSKVEGLVRYCSKGNLITLLRLIELK